MGNDMGDSWNAYVAYADQVERNNIKPELVEGGLPVGAAPMTEIGRHGHEVGVEAKFVEGGKVWELPDGRVAETGNHWRPIYYVWPCDEDRRTYRRALPVNLYLHG